jgi:lysophospholipase L1-like esterase
MNKTLLTAAVSFALLLMSAASGFCEGKALAEPFKKNERIVFFGDSITHGGKSHMLVLLAQAVRHPGSNVMIMNGGISGDTAGGGLKRLDCDILSKNPDRVFIMFGMNDVGITNYNGKNDEKTKAARARSLNRYKSNMEKCIEKLMAAGKKVVLITPTPYDEYTNQFNTNKFIGANEIGLAECAETVRVLAEKYKIRYIDFHKPLTGILKKGLGIFIRSDRVHPSSAGHAVMAAILLESLGEKPLRIRCEIDAVSGKYTAKNVKITNLKTTPERVSFRYTPATLMFPLNANMKKAETIYPVAAAFNDEKLSVKKLAKGVYDINAEGCALGKFSSEQLATGLDMPYFKTPAYYNAVRADNTRQRIYVLNSKLRGIVMMRTTAKAYGKCDTMQDEFAALDTFLQTPSVKGRQYYINMVNAYKKDRPKKEAYQKELDGLYAKLYASAKTCGFNIMIRKVN